MQDNNENKATNDSKSGSKKVLKSMIDGSVLTRDGFLDQLPYILFLTVIAVLYIGNRFHAEKILRQTHTVQQELRDLRAESLTSASKLMYISKQSEVIKLVHKHNLNLKEAIEPPRQLIVDKP